MVYTATLAYYLDNAFEEAGLILPVSWGALMLCWAVLVWRRGGWALPLAIARPAAACCCPCVIFGVIFAIVSAGLLTGSFGPMVPCARLSGGGRHLWH